MTISGIVTRHFQKARPKVKVAYGGPEDLALTLSDEGRSNSHDAGRRLIAPDHDSIYAVASDFERAAETVRLMLDAAGYCPANSENVIRDPALGFGGLDFDAPELKPALDAYEKSGSEDAFVEVALQSLYKADPENPLVMSAARDAYALFDRFLKGVESERNKGSENGLVILGTHNPNIDPLAGTISGYMRVDGEGNVALYNFPGSLEMGQAIRVEIPEPASDNPTVIFTFPQEKFGGLVTKYNLKDIEDMRRMHAEYAGLRK